MRREEDQPQARTFDAGMDFIRRNHGDDRWFLQIETFDPHEPFFSQRKYKDLYPQHYLDYQGPLHDWPAYDWVAETREQVEHMRYEYAALLSMCDSKLGDVLDLMDELDLWEDTLLVMWTDHGFLLSEHDCWAKCWMPFYEEVAHTPFFVWDPRCGKKGERRQSLVQPSIDLGPTVLDFFGLEPTPDMRGQVLRETVAFDRPVRQTALFGQHGHQVNLTDGRYVYMRGPATEDNTPLFDYTLMPTHMREAFSVDELRDRIQLAAPFDFTKGCQTMKIPSKGRFDIRQFGTLLYDLEEDPHQEQSLEDKALAARLGAQMVELMKAYEAPSEQFERLGL
jgi:arylsulfatase A-like enzyme